MGTAPLFSGGENRGAVPIFPVTKDAAQRSIRTFYEVVFILP